MNYLEYFHKIPLQLDASATELPYSKELAVTTLWNNFGLTHRLHCGTKTPTVIQTFYFAYLWKPFTFIKLLFFPLTIFRWFRSKVLKFYFKTCISTCLCLDISFMNLFKFVRHKLCRIFLQEEEYML